VCSSDLDPSVVGHFRYWNGAEWTPGVVIAGQVMERPMPWPPVGPIYTAYPTYPAHPGYTGHAPAKPPDERVELPAKALLYALAGFVIGLVGGFALGLGGSFLGLPDIVVLILDLGGLWTGLIGACWMASRRWGTGNLAHDYGFKIQGADVGWGMLMSLAARVAGAIVAVPFAFGPERMLDNNTDTFGGVTDTWAAFAVFAVIAIVGAPIVEELFFRGLLLRALTTKVGTVVAIGISAVLFGLAHVSPLLGLANFTVVTVISAAGVVFGITAWWRRVGTSVVAHAAFNVIAVIAAGILNFT
jgi:membrane protease YdiL (CAAX protease family)